MKTYMTHKYLTPCFLVQNDPFQLNLLPKYYLQTRHGLFLFSLMFNVMVPLRVGPTAPMFVLSFFL